MVTVNSDCANLNYYQDLPPTLVLEVVKTASEETIERIAACLNMIQVEYVRDMLAVPEKVNLLLSVWNRAHPESQL
jgi:hypothetical protein